LKNGCKPLTVKPLTVTLSLTASVFRRVRGQRRDATGHLLLRDSWNGRAGSSAAAVRTG